MQSIKTHSEYKIILFLHDALLIIKKITVYKNETNIKIAYCWYIVICHENNKIFKDYNV